MPATPITAVVFDFGGVVVEWNMGALFGQFFDTQGELDHFMSNVFTEEQNLRVDLGEPVAAVVAELVERHPEHRAPIEAYRDRWIETIPGIVPGTGELTDALRSSGYKLLGLSNFSRETFPLCVERYPVFDVFDDIVLSGDLGIAKPDPAIYMALCDRNGISPEQAVFIDDRANNVEAASAVGMKAVLFRSATETADALRALGLEF